MKVGIIGLGEVAQLMHLPILNDLSDKYSIQAVSDVSPSLVSFISKKYHVPQFFTNAVQLIEESDTDIVFVLSPDQYHGEYIERALKKGKHVFVEKPAALYSKEIEQLIELKKQYPNQTLMVGYMRRFSDPFLKAKEILQTAPKKTEYIRFRDIICEGPFFIRQTRPIFYPNDVPKTVIDEGRARRTEHLDKALGSTASEAQRTAFQMMTGLGCHTFSAVRELFGLPKEIKSVVTSPSGAHIIIVMEFDGFLGLYELVNDQEVVQFDATIEIFQHDRKLIFSYETPYVRYQPMSLDVIETSATETKTTRYGPSWHDPFQAELIELYNCIQEKRAPKTTLDDALLDIQFFEKLMR
jgi:predicted dehydrogenase